MTADRRRYYRLRYSGQGAPSVSIEGVEVQLTELSECGLRFKDSVEQRDLGQTYRVSLSLPNGRVVDIGEATVEERGGELVALFDHKVSSSVVLKEQRRMIREASGLKGDDKSAAMDALRPPGRSS